MVNRSGLQRRDCWSGLCKTVAVRFRLFRGGDAGHGDVRARQRGLVRLPYRFFCFVDVMVQVEKACKGRGRERLRENREARCGPGAGEWRSGAAVMRGKLGVSASALVVRLPRRNGGGHSGYLGYRNRRLEPDASNIDQDGSARSARHVRRRLRPRYGRFAGWRPIYWRCSVDAACGGARPIRTGYDLGGS